MVPQPHERLGVRRRRRGTRAASGPGTCLRHPGGGSAADAPIAARAGILSARPNMIDGSNLAAFEERRRPSAKADRYAEPTFMHPRQCQEGIGW